MIKVPEKLRVPLNFVGYQASWFACVIGENTWAIPVVAVFLLWHTQVARQGEWALIGLVALGGILLDNLWFNLGFTAYPASLNSFPADAYPFIPLWLVLLWVAFSATLLHAMHYFFKRPLLISSIAAFAAPLSYFAGTKLDALTMTQTGYITLGLGWGVLMYLAAKGHQILQTKGKLNAPA